MKKVAETAPLSSSDDNKAQSTQILSGKPILFYAIAYVVCILAAIRPLHLAAGVPYIQLFTNRILLAFGSWLPIDIYHVHDWQASQSGTAITFFILLMWLAFIFYGLSAYAILRSPSQANYRNIWRIIWAMTVVVGGIFIVTPAMLSHDIFVYVSYGRILTYYHTNPYFVPFTYFSQDPFTPYNDWKNVLSAYGPVWETVSAVASIVIRSHLGRNLMVFRSIAFAAHLLNAALIALILRAMGRSPRTVTLGTLLYVWNPLALEESSLGGHNDVFMVTLILAGIYFYLRAEQQAQEPIWQRFLPSALAFSLAVLVKLTALPVLALYILLLAIRAFKETPLPDKTLSSALFVSRAHIVNVLKWVAPVAVTSVVVILGIYAPYWVGHSTTGIIYSFTSPPSSSSSYGSILYGLIKWMKDHGLSQPGSLKYLVLTTIINHKFWNVIGVVTLVAMLAISTFWLWHAPTARTLVLTIIATLSAVLLVTFWFFPWYLLWIIGLAPLLLPIRYQRIERALFAFVITFTIMGVFYYIYRNNTPPFGSWNVISAVTTFFIPFVVFVIFLFLPGRTRQQKATVPLAAD
jgi:hypothetical protein